MKVGDLVKFDPVMCTDPTVGVIVQAEPPSKRRMRLVAVLWPDGLQDDVAESWLVKA